MKAFSLFYITHTYVHTYIYYIYMYICICVYIYISYISIFIVLIHYCHHGRLSISGASHGRNVSAKGTLAGLIDVDSLLISLHYTLRILQVLPSRSPAHATPDIARGSLVSSFVTLRL